MTWDDLLSEISFGSSQRRQLNGATKQAQCFMAIVEEYLICLVAAVVATAVFCPGTVRALASLPSGPGRTELSEDDVRRQVARARSGAYVLLAVVPVATRITPEMNWLVLPFLAPALWYGVYVLLLRLAKS